MLVLLMAATGMAAPAQKPQPTLRDVIWYCHTTHHVFFTIQTKGIEEKDLDSLARMRIILDQLLLSQHVLFDQSKTPSLAEALGAVTNSLPYVIAVRSSVRSNVWHLIDVHTLGTGPKGDILGENNFYGLPIRITFVTVAHRK